MIGAAEIPLEEFAADIGVKPKVVARWLDAKYFPKFENVVKIADRLDCSVDYLFGRTFIRQSAHTDHPSEFMDRFLSLKAENGLSEFVLAQKCGFQSSAISKWRHQHFLPNTNIMLKMVDFFGCTIEYLIGRSDYR